MKSTKLTVDNFYLESENFEAWWIERRQFFQITTKSGRYVDCQSSVEGVKQSFAYYEKRKSASEIVGDYLETDNFYAKISDTRTYHLIFSADGKQAYYPVEGEDVINILNQFEKQLKS